MAHLPSNESLSSDDESSYELIDDLLPRSNDLDTVAETAVEDIPAETRPWKKVVREGVKGTVKWYNVKKAYGFITRDDTKEEYFVHSTAIANNNPNKYKHSLGDGEKVLFDIAMGKRYEAVNVTGPKGAPVLGSEHARDINQKRRRRRGGAPNVKKGDSGDGDKQKDPMMMNEPTYTPTIVHDENDALPKRNEIAKPPSDVAGATELPQKKDSLDDAATAREAVIQCHRGETKRSMKVSENERQSWVYSRTVLRWITIPSLVCAVLSVLLSYWPIVTVLLAINFLCLLGSGFADIEASLDKERTMSIRKGNVDYEVKYLSDDTIRDVIDCFQALPGLEKYKLSMNVLVQNIAWMPAVETQEISLLDEMQSRLILGSHFRG